MDKLHFQPLVVLVCAASCCCFLFEDKLPVIPTARAPKCRGYNKLRFRSLTETPRNGTVPAGKLRHTFRSAVVGRPVRVSYAVRGTGFLPFNVISFEVKLKNVEKLTVKFAANRTTVIQQYSKPTNETTWTFDLPQPRGLAAEPVLRLLLRAVPEHDTKAEMRVVKVVGCKADGQHDEADGDRHEDNSDIYTADVDDDDDDDDKDED